MTYSRGEDVLRDKEPFVHMVLPKYRKVICDNCFKKASEIGGEIKSCTRCKMVHYCDKTCQSNTWTYIINLNVDILKKLILDFYTILK